MHCKKKERAVISAADREPSPGEDLDVSCEREMLAKRANLLKILLTSSARSRHSRISKQVSGSYQRSMLNGKVLSLISISKSRVGGDTRIRIRANTTTTKR